MYIFIINPVAGNKLGEMIYKRFMNAHPELQSNSSVYYTTKSDEAILLTKQIVSEHRGKIKVLIIIGGDGTFYEVINGLTSEDEILLAFVPAGSGNDFARGNQMSLNGFKQIETIVQEHQLHPYWFGEYRVDKEENQTPKRFATSMGFGFDAEVASFVNQSKWKSRLNAWKLTPLIYVLGLITNLFIYSPKDLKLNLDGQILSKEDVWMITVSNHPYFGGGMKIAPEAKVNGEYFTVTIVNKIARLKVFILFITVFFGLHTRLKEVETYQARVISVESDEAIPFQVDGFTSSTYYSHIKKGIKATYIVKK
ncbi:diacylglycerol/lipid kinase family protein [Halalkalibacillus halophilus]|uniref:diacylglycerol/lipid kinase family protein n=1 Tax=Halalkalibacillus halophilus TaxID=392827 RepID=UPI0003FD2CD2|nr:diacylglycerol kinase family protein [Halalkalibacillus halophilus]